MVNSEICNPSPGVNLTGMREDFLQLAIGQETSLSLCHVLPKRKMTLVDTSIGQTLGEASGDSGPESLQLMVIDEKRDSISRNSSGLPNQVASQVILWLHEEALVVGMKASRDFLCLKFSLDQGETPGLVAHLDPHDTQGCTSWWLVVDHGLSEEAPLSAENGGSDYKIFLGHLSLEV